MWVMTSAGMLKPSTSRSGSDRLPAKFPALVKCIDPEAAMHQRCGHKMPFLPEEIARNSVIDPGGQRIHRDIAERVVEEMADQIKHQPADQSNLADADAADESCEVFLSDVAMRSSRTLHAIDCGY